MPCNQTKRWNLPLRQAWNPSLWHTIDPCMQEQTNERTNTFYHTTNNRVRCYNCIVVCGSTARYYKLPRACVPSVRVCLCKN
mmetsp:Transcript_21261/g.44753  ORF Transcript_21261/g.44753 Transcript_21261/m.44753 type:complete len:82 (-) Transcript_21261:30-275(-)